MKKMIVTIILILCALFFLGGGIFSYLLPTPIGEEERNDFTTDTLYGDGTGVDQALLVETTNDAFLRRLELIDAAEESLDIVYHAVKGGDTTKILCHEILNAADRGVKVRFLVDAKTSDLHGAQSGIPLALRSHENVTYATYNPVNILKPWRWNALLHDKFIICDDKYLLLGGRNLGDEYFNPPWYSGRVTHDRDVLVYNTAFATEESDESVIYQAKSYMDELWNHGATSIKDGELSDKDSMKAAEAVTSMGAIADARRAEYPDYFAIEVPAADAAVPTAKITLLANPIDAFKKKPILGYQLGELAKEGTSVRIQSPYATANPKLLRALRDIGETATDFRLQTNSMASTPNFPAFSAYRFTRHRFLATGIDIYEIQSYDSIHGKSMLIDSRISVVGSLNLDDRSLYIDTETALVIDSPAFNEILTKEFDDLQDNSARLGPNNRYVNDGSVEILPVSPLKVGLMFTVSIFSRLFRFLI